MRWVVNLVIILSISPIPHYYSKAEVDDIFFSGNVVTHVKVVQQGTYGVGSTWKLINDCTDINNDRITLIS